MLFSHHRFDLFLGFVNQIYVFRLDSEHRDVVISGKSLLCSCQRYKQNVIKIPAKTKASTARLHHTYHRESHHHSFSFFSSDFPISTTCDLDLLADGLIIAKQFGCQFGSNNTDFLPIVEFGFCKETSSPYLPIHPNRKVRINTVIPGAAFSTLCGLNENATPSRNTRYHQFNGRTLRFNGYDIIVL